LGVPSNVEDTTGADGIAFDSDGFLIVGGQNTVAWRVDPSQTDPPISITTPQESFHVSMDPRGDRAWAGWFGNTGINEIPYGSPFSNFGPATLLTTSGPDADSILSLAWPNPATPTHAFYTAGGTGGTDGFGNFGEIDLNTGVTTQHLVGLPAAHGLSFDPFTGTLILYGDDHITQIDPANPTLPLADFNLTPSPDGSTFDQGTPDGHGHLFVARNSGNLFFMDMAATHRVDAPSFTEVTFLDSCLDDIAPLVGPGSVGGCS
jgi:hypothetical protein